MSNSAINTQVAQQKIGNVQNQADTSAVYNGGIWSFKNSTAVTSVTIDNSGNVGIGRTTNLSGAGTFRGVGIGATGSLMASTTTGGFYCAQNIYWDGSVWRYLTNGTASLYEQAGGGHTWFYAASGTAGNSSTNVQAMTIASDGNIGIGAAAGSDKVYIRYSSAFTGLAVQNASAPTGSGLIQISTLQAGNVNDYALVSQSGNGSTVTTNNLFIRTNGNVQNLNNSYGAISDKKLKENITDATPKLEKIKQVRIVNFNMIGSEQKQIGVIAQELEEIFPSMVDTCADRDIEGNEIGEFTKSVKYSVFVPILIKAIQELSAKVDFQDREIRRLKGEAVEEPVAPAPVIEPAPAPAVEQPAPQPEAQSQSVLQPEPEIQPEPTVQSEPEVQSQSAPQPAPEPEVQPVSEPESP